MIANDYLVNLPMITKGIYQWLPSGKRLHSYGKSTHFNGYVITISTGLYSIAMLNNQYTLW